MQLDYGRQQDLDQMWIDLQKETSPFWREMIQKNMDKILRESGATRNLRDELIRATRVNDRNRMEYLRLELRRLDAEKVNNNVRL